MTGTIPSCLGFLTNSKQLNIYGNSFTGTIPSSLCLLLELQHFNLYDMMLTGTIPSCLGQFTYLQLLSLEYNSLTGTLPSTLGWLQNLTLFDVTENQLSGTIPWEFGNLTRLQVFRLNNNNLHGTLPLFLQYAYALTALDLSYNSFSGTIPSFFTDLPSMKWLNLRANRFTGPMPFLIGNIQSLEGLLLDSNKLISTVPSSIKNLSHLKYLTLYKNRLMGSVPPLDKLSNLIWVLLNDNLFSGSLHDISINSSYLELYDVSNNRFTGTIPSLPFLSHNLEVFATAGNCLIRYLSNNICVAQGLRVLALDGLRASPHCTAPFLHGVSSKSYVLNADTKSVIPPCIFSMPHLEILHLSGNAFTGTLPSIIEYSSSLIDLTLSHNVLSGTIPSAIQTKSWSRLDLSYNKFSGTLENTVGMGNSSLSLVVNRLSGKTPSVLSSSRNIDLLRGNLFECNFDTRVLPKYDSAAKSYTCASDALEIAFFLCMGVLGLGLLAAMVLYLRKSDTCLRLITFVWTYLVHSPQETKVDKIMSQLRHMCTFLTCLIVVALLPTYSALGLFYGNRHYRYGWIVSAAYLSGSGAAIVLLLIWTCLLFYFLYSITRLFAVISNQQSDVSLLMDALKMTPRNSALHMSLIGIMVIFDFAVIFLSNSLYISVATLFGYKDSVLVQILAGALKFLWNTLFVQNIHSITQYVLGTEGETLIVFDTLAIFFLTLMNYIIIPVFAEAVIDPHCFYNVLFTSDPVSVSYTFNGLCVSVFIANSKLFCYHTSVELSTTYIPPFIYTYECSSALLVNYVTVFIYLFLSMYVFSPLRVIFFLFLRHPSSQRLGIHCYFESSSNDNNAENVVVLHMNVINEWTWFLSSCIILMTFGVVYPPLAVIICLSVIIDTVAVQYLIHEGLAILDGDIPNTGQLSVLLIIIIICVFDAWFLFDIAGDELGGTAAIWAPLVSIILPLSLWLFYMVIIPIRSSSTVPLARSLSRIHVHVQDL